MYDMMSFEVHRLRSPEGGSRTVVVFPTPVKVGVIGGSKPPVGKIGLPVCQELFGMLCDEKCNVGPIRYSRHLSAFPIPTQTSEDLAKNKRPPGPERLKFSI
jgi:hypothetical protein